MNKKAFFSVMEGPIFPYSLIAAIIVTVIFSFLFWGAGKKSADEIIADSIIAKSQIYDYLDYYLYTKIRVDKKETSLIELFTLYCTNSDEKTLGKTKKISAFLTGDNLDIKVACINREVKCKDLLAIQRDEDSEFALPYLNLKETDKYVISQGVILNYLIFELPSIKDSSHVCLAVDKKPLKIAQIESVSSSKVFKERVNSEEITLIISPTKDLWYKEDKWCNPIEDDCSKQITKEDLLACEGDYLKCS